MSLPDAPPARRAPGSDAPLRWTLDPALLFGVAAAVFLAGLGIVTRQPVVVLVALPVLVSAGWSRWGRAAATGRVRATTLLDPGPAGQGVGYRTAVELPPDAEAVAVVVTVAGGRRHAVVVDPERAGALHGVVPVTHSGPQEIIRLHWSVLARGGAEVSAPDEGPVVTGVVPPPHLRMEHLPMPLRVTGITGGHDSANPGDGGEFRDVALFAPGDRLRRIDWRRTARRAERPGDLYVRRTFSTADALVVLVVDGRDDLGADVTEWGGVRHGEPEATSLDIAREAATSLATAYITAGDRVGLRDLAGTARSVEPGGGSRHLERLRSTIASVAPDAEASARVRMPLVPAASLVVVLSTFLDDDASTMALSWAGRGHRVVAIDTLPQPDPERANRQQRAALRLLSLERDDRLDAMTAAGVELVRWRPADGSSPAVQLRLLSRPRRAR